MNDAELEYALKNWDNLPKEEQDYLNQQWNISHKKYIRKQRVEALLLWLKTNWIGLSTLIVSIAALVVGIIALQK